MLELVKGSTSVELKMTVPDANHRAAIRGLGFDPVEAQPRQAYFFDTPDLALNTSRHDRSRTQNPGWARGYRRQTSSSGPGHDRQQPPSFTGLQDRTGRDARGLCVLGLIQRRVHGPRGARRRRRRSSPGIAVLEGTTRLLRCACASGHQDQFVGAFGPRFSTQGQVPTERLRSPHHVEMWLYPDGSRIFEISTKCLPKECFQVQIFHRSPGERAMISARSPNAAARSSPHGPGIGKSNCSSVGMASLSSTADLGRSYPALRPAIGTRPAAVIRSPSGDRLRPRGTAWPRNGAAARGRCPRCRLRRSAPRRRPGRPRRRGGARREVRTGRAARGAG